MASDQDDDRFKAPDRDRIRCSCSITASAAGRKIPRRIPADNTGRSSNGNFHFNTGALLMDASFSARSIEVNPQGKMIYVLETTGAAVYRSNRVVDFYTPPVR